MELTERNEKLQRLTEYPEWAELVAVFQERKEREATGLAKRVLSPGGGGVTQAEIITKGTFWGGVEAVLDTPGFIHKKLETAIKRAQQTEGDR